MAEMLSVIGPMFLIILLGFAVGFMGKFRQAGPHLNAFVFYFGLPAFLYTAMVNSPEVTNFPVAALLIPATVTVALAVAVYLVCRLRGSWRSQAAPTALSGTFGNVGYFGVPISIGLLGPEAGLVAGLIHAVHNIVFMTGYPVVRVAAGGVASAADQVQPRPAWYQQLWRVLSKAVLLNPVFMLISLALLVVFTPVEMPSFFNEPVAMLGQTAVPVALFCVGVALHPALEGLRSGSVPAIPLALGTVAKLLILPAVTWLVVLPFYDQLGPVWAGVIIVMAATPSSTTVFLLAEQYDGDGRLAAAILVLSTVLSLVSLPLMAEFLL